MKQRVGYEDEKANVSTFNEEAIGLVRFIEDGLRKSEQGSTTRNFEGYY